MFPPREPDRLLNTFTQVWDVPGSVVFKVILKDGNYLRVEGKGDQECIESLLSQILELYAKPYTGSYKKDDEKGKKTKKL